MIIAHRMRTVEQADKLVVLKDGEIVEMGSPDQLKKKNGLFAHMLKLQRESSEWKI